MVFKAFRSSKDSSATQHTLSGRSIESIFVGIAHDYAGGVVLFNPATKRSIVRHSFKYLNDNDPISTSYVVFDDSSPSSTPAESLLDSLPNLEPILEPSEDFQYVPVPFSKAAATMKFAYVHIGSNFVEKSTNISYRINDIVRVTSASSIPTICLQFYDISSSLIPPTDS